MKVICVPVIDRPECAVALSAAFELGNNIGAAIMGYHLRDHGDSKISVHEDVAALVKDNEQSTLVESNTQHQAELLFKKLAEQQGYPFKNKASKAPIALWQAKAGSPNKLFSIVGPVTDLIIVSRPKSGGKKAKKFMLSALLNSAKPVLVLPQEKYISVAKHICIAWNQSPEVSRVVTAAISLLKNAEQVTIVTNGAENKLGPKSRHLQNYLTMHGVNSQHVKLNENNDTEALMRCYDESGSDLLLMGAYSKSRLRQVIFGGVTEHMLFDANIPVLMLHN